MVTSGRRASLNFTHAGIVRIVRANVPGTRYHSTWYVWWVFGAGHENEIRSCHPETYSSVQCTPRQNLNSKVYIILYTCVYCIIVLY